jgi:hypothetical protein
MTMPEPPQNGGYLIAAYIVAALISIGYMVSLWVRSGKELRARGNK